MAFSYYTVTVTPKQETWNNKQYTTKCYARSREEAIKQARAEYKRENQDYGQTSATYRCSKDEEDGESRFVLDGYNVEFQGARPAAVAQDY